MWCLFLKLDKTFQWPAWRAVKSSRSRYHLSGGKTLPQFLEDAHKNSKSLKRDESFRRRLDLIQDLEYPVASSQIRISEDEKFLVTSGCYPPEAKIYDVAELGMKLCFF